MIPISIIQFGLGGVGRALVEQVFATRDTQARLGIHLHYTAVADSAGALLEERGLDEGIIMSALRFKARGGSLHEHEAGYYQQDLAALVDVAGQPGTIVVDTTAAERAATFPAFEMALWRGYHVVLANKKPLTGPYSDWQALTEDGRTWYEATVGAGLPVIRTLRYLLDTGDEVRTIEGAFSGTLGFLMSQLQNGVPFAEAVRDARSRGWTEPDPRDDLSGMDVARKALILARTTGREEELEQVRVTPLFPPEWTGLALDEFMNQLDELNPLLAEQHDVAKSQGRRLRYAATVHTDALEVGPISVSPDTPLGGLAGADNLVAFHTARYGNRPLVIQGAGAGTEVTASALLGDVFQASQALV